MNQVKIQVHVSQSEAIRQGKNAYGTQVVEINPADLTPEQREVLADIETVYAAGEYVPSVTRVTVNGRIYSLPPIGEATTENIKYLLDSVPKTIARIQRETAEKEERKAAQVAKWVAEKGTDNQKKRAALNLLPEKEILDAMRDEVFAPLAEFSRYGKLTRSDVPCWCEDEDAPHAKFGAKDADSATAEQFSAMEKISDLIPGATVTLRVHRGWCMECETPDGEDGNVERHSIKVAVTVGDFDFTREYAV